MTKVINLSSLEFDDVDTKDYPDFSDAYVCYAEYKDGTPLTDIELNQFNDNNRDIVHEQLFATIY